jgi:hypothetical protein
VGEIKHPLITEGLKRKIEEIGFEEKVERGLRIILEFEVDEFAERRFAFG